MTKNKIQAGLIIGTALIGVFVQFREMIESFFRFLPGDAQDTRFNMFVLEWGYQSLIGAYQSQSFWNPPIFYPVQNTLSYSDILLGTAPFYWLFRIFSCSVESSFCLWLITNSLANFFSFYLWLRFGMKQSKVGSVAGSFLFAFSGCRFAHLCHAQLFVSFYTPLAFFGLCQFFQARKAALQISGAALFVFSCVGQLYAGFYLGWFLIFGLSVGFVLSLIDQTSRIIVLNRIKKDFWSLAVIALLGLVCLSPLLLHYGQTVQELGARQLDEVFPPKPQSFLFLGTQSLLYSWQAKVRGFQIIENVEQIIGVGFISLSLAGIGLYQARGELAGRKIGEIGLVLIGLCTRFYKNIWAWPLFFYLFPGASAIRALSRVGIAILPFWGFGFSNFLTRNQKRIFSLRAGSKLLFIPLLSLSFLEQIRTERGFDSQEFRLRVEKLHKSIPEYCQSFVALSAAGEKITPIEQIDAMWATLIDPQRPLVHSLNGLSGKRPKKYSVDSQEGALRWMRLKDSEEKNHCFVYY